MADIFLSHPPRTYPLQDNRINRLFAQLPFRFKMDAHWKMAFFGFAPVTNRVISSLDLKCRRLHQRGKFHSNQPGDQYCS